MQVNQGIIGKIDRIAYLLQKAQASQQCLAFAEVCESLLIACDGSGSLEMLDILANAQHFAGLRELRLDAAPWRDF